MNILALSTSGRLNGNTSRLLKIMLDKLSFLGAQTEFIWTGNKKIEFCRACEHCMSPVRDSGASAPRHSKTSDFNKTNHNNTLTLSNETNSISNGVKEDKCIIQDDYEEIRQKMLNADGVILGTPNYAFQMSAQLKAIYDRSHSLLYYTRRLGGKYAVGVCVGGHSYMTAKIAKTVAQGIWLCGGYYVGYLGAASVNRDELSLQKEEQIVKKAGHLAEKLYSAIRDKKKFQWQHFIRKRFLYPQVAKMVKNNKSKYPFLYEYYKSNGYL